MHPASSEAESFVALAGPPSAHGRGRLRNAWWALVAIFLVHGLVVSTWVSRIPAVKSALHLSDGTFGMALLGSAIGSLIGIPVCGWLVTRFGSRRISTWTSIGFCLALMLPAFAVNAPTLFAALFALGWMAGSLWTRTV